MAELRPLTFRFPDEKGKSRSLTVIFGLQGWVFVLPAILDGKLLLLLKYSLKGYRYKHGNAELRLTHSAVARFRKLVYLGQKYSATVEKEPRFLSPGEILKLPQGARNELVTDDDVQGVRKQLETLSEECGEASAKEPFPVEYTKFSFEDVSGAKHTFSLMSGGSSVWMGLLDGKRVLMKESSLLLHQASFQCSDIAFTLTKRFARRWTLECGGRMFSHETPTIKKKITRSRFLETPLGPMNELLNDGTIHERLESLGYEPPFELHVSQAVRSRAAFWAIVVWLVVFALLVTVSNWYISVHGWGEPWDFLLRIAFFFASLRGARDNARGIRRRIHRKHATRKPV